MGTSPALESPTDVTEETLLWSELKLLLYMTAGTHLLNNVLFIVIRHHILLPLFTTMARVSSSLKKLKKSNVELKYSCFI